jgi:methyl-accepting chemotaxis protein
MPEINKNTFLPSIRSWIWFVIVSIVAVIMAAALFAGYLLFVLDGANSPWAILPIMLVPVVVVALGWWLSREITESIAKLAIAAQILERGGFNSSLPETGAQETEEILEKLQRYNQGIQRMSAAMEQVAKGEINISMRPNSATDRFGVAFQKLLEETSTAIKVKTDLVELQDSLKNISAKIAGAKYGDLTVEADTSVEVTGSVSNVVNHLVKDLRDTVSQIRVSAARSQSGALDIQKTLQGVLDSNEEMSGEKNDASVTLKQLPKAAHRFSEKLGDSSSQILRSQAQSSKSVKIIQTNLSSINTIRSQIDDAARRFQRMSEFSQEVGNIVKVVEDLARRTNLIALNASIQANEAGDAGLGFGLVVKELEHLAEKSANATKQFSTMTQIIQSESKEARSAIEETVRETASISKFSVETLEALHELDKNINQLAEMHENMLASAQKQSLDVNVVSKVFLESNAETQKSLITIKNVINTTNKIVKVSQEMSANVSAFKLPLGEDESKPKYLSKAAPPRLNSEMVN